MLIISFDNFNSLNFIKSDFLDMAKIDLLDFVKSDFIYFSQIYNFRMFFDTLINIIITSIILYILILLNFTDLDT